MTALVLMVLLQVPAAQEPSHLVVAELGLSSGARAVTAPQGTFFFGVDAGLGLRFDPVRFGARVRGLFTSQSGLDVGGFFGVDLVRVKLDARRNVALFTAVEVLGRFIPQRATPWSTVVLGQFGVRALGISLSLVGGAELGPPLGTGEVRLGVDLVELLGN